ncbi:MFS transporter [Halobacteriaceae archaeon SHR40]|uniref:MFS transporter n=1 Tax=Halovenus amylolytica TaxID=2500550 RepID=UPI000FE40372
MSERTESAQAAASEYPPLWRNWNFLRFFAGRFVTNVGDSLYSIAILWLVFELGESTALTGAANSLLLLPFLLQIVAGPVVDRFRIKPILVGSQLVQGVVVLVVAIAAVTGTVTLELLFALIPVLAVMNLLIGPVQSTLVPRIVADGQLSRTNSALGTITYGVDSLFEAVGGIFIAVFGTTALFVFDSATFVVAAILFAGMQIPTVAGGHEDQPSAIRTYVADLRAGIEILRGTVFVELLFLSAVSNFAVGVSLALLPAFGSSLGGPTVYGLLLGALGVGRVVGSAVASSLKTVPYGRLVTGSYLLAGVCWLGSVVTPSVGLTVGLFGLAWVPAGIDAVLIATLNQKVFPTSILGRISAIKGTAATATLPIGSLVGGLVGEQLGITATMGLAAVGFAFPGLYVAVRSSLRRLPAVANADPSQFNVDAVPANSEKE